jgi:hypothetical protein
VGPHDAQTRQPFEQIIQFHDGSAKDRNGSAAPVRTASQLAGKVVKDGSKLDGSAATLPR